MDTSNQRGPAPRPRLSRGALALHAGITAALFALGFTLLSERAPLPSRGSENTAAVNEAREQLAKTRRRILRLAPRLEEVAQPAPAAPVPGAARRPSRLQALVPALDDPPIVMERFAKRLVALHQRSAQQRLLAYYDTVLRPLLLGYDDAVLDRLKAGLSTYAVAAKAIPWGRLRPGDKEASALWRAYLLRIDRDLRAVLAEDLTPEKSELLYGRFAVKVPAEGQPLPSPRLGGDQGR